MKFLKFVFLSFLLFFYPNFLFSQEEGEYVILPYTKYVKNFGHGSEKCRIKSYYNEDIFLERNFGDMNNGEIQSFHDYEITPHTYKTSQRPPILYFYSYRFVDAWLKKNQARYDATRQFNIDEHYPYCKDKILKKDDNGDDLYYGYHTEVELIIYPKDLSASLINNAMIDLPVDDEVTRIQTFSGFDNSAYQWQYSFNQTTWTSINISKGSNLLTLKAKDLFPTNYNNNIGKDIYFRIKVPDGYATVNKSQVLTIVPSAPHIQSYKITQPTCNGYSDGKIVLKLDRKLYAGEKVTLRSCNVINGRWDVGNKIDSITTTNIDSFVITGLKEGTYYYMLEGTYKGRTCYKMGEKHHATVKVGQPSAFDFSSSFNASSQSISCHGGSDGSLSLKAKGGKFPFKYSWKQENETEWSDTTSSKSSFTINNLSAGKYQFNVSDRYGCGQSDTIKEFTMKQPERITASGTFTNVTEYGAADGSINYAFTLGNNNNGRKYEYRWEDSQHKTLTPKVTMYEGYTGTELNNLPADTFLLTVSITKSGTEKPIPPYTTPDGAGCQSTFKVVITQPDPIVIDIDTLKWVSCTNGNDGQLNAHVTGGVKPYTFKWENEKSVAICSDSTLTGSVGKYTLHFTDANGIKRETSAYLPQIDSLKTILENVTKVFCKGNATGEVAIAVKGGTQPYSFLWSSGEQTQNITRKTAGDYEVTVSDANHCKDTLDVTIESSDAISYDLTTKNLTCYHSNDGEIAVSNVAGGNPPYAISWSNGEKDYTLSHLPADSYKGAIIDSRNCIEVIDVMLSEPDTIIPRIEKDIYTLCKGQKQPLDIATANAKSYAWYNGEVKISDNQQIVIAEAGVYRAEITDNDNCFGQKNFEVRTTDNEIYADFIVASSVAQDSVLRAVNITRSDFETMEWLLDDDSDIWVSEDNPYSLEVAFARQDTFNITLRTSQWGCEAITTKSIVVVDASELEEYEEGDVAYIRKFLVTPNPTDGEFDATIELGEAMDVTLYMYTANSHLPLEERHLTGAKWYKEHFSVSLVSGTYFLRLVTPNPRIYSVAKIVVK